MLEEDKVKYLRMLRQPKTDILRRKQIFRTVVESCKKVRECPYCKQYNGMVKKLPGQARIFHDKYNKSTPKDIMDERDEHLKEFLTQNSKELVQYLHKVQEDLSPLV